MRYLLAGVLAVVTAGTGAGDAPQEPADCPLSNQGAFRGKWDVVSFRVGGKELLTGDAEGVVRGDDQTVSLHPIRDAGNRVAFGDFRLDQSGHLPAVDLDK
jgi:hypothetical protein